MRLPVPLRAMPRPGRPGPFLGRPFDLFTVGGIAVAVHPSWLLVAAGISVLLRVNIVDHIPGVAGVAAAIGLMLVFYTCVLLHELAHSLVAQRHGLQPRRIVLFLLGGVSQIEKEATRPSHEYQVALSGPLVSLVLAGILFAVARTTGEHSDVSVSVWGFLGWLNLLLAGFNLVPGFPLDGGRVLRSALWAITGDRARSTRIAAAGGKIVATALMAGGVFAVVTIAESRQGALSFVVVGWFLYSMAGAAAEREGAYPPKPEPAPSVVVEPAPPPASSPQVVLPAADIIPAPRRRAAPRSKRSVPAGRRASGGLPAPTPVRRPERKADRTPAPRTARLVEKAAVGRPSRQGAKGAHEGSATKPNTRGRAARPADGARAAGASRDQSRDRARHPRSGSADARGAARRDR